MGHVCDVNESITQVEDVLSLEQLFLSFLVALHGNDAHVPRGECAPKSLKPSPIDRVNHAEGQKKPGVASDNLEVCYRVFSQRVVAAGGAGGRRHALLFLRDKNSSSGKAPPYQD